MINDQTENNQVGSKKLTYNDVLKTKNKDDYDVLDLAIIEKSRECISILISVINSTEWSSDGIGKFKLILLQIKY